MKFALLLVFVVSGCISPALGPDYSHAKKWCRDRGGLKGGNPIDFTCNDKSKWLRCSHGNYDFQGWEK